MNFRKDDIEAILSYDGRGPAGVYNQLTWQVVSSNDTTHIMDQMVSVHEFMHNELNNTTAYGFLLQVYAYLAKENTPLQDHYTNVLEELVESCRTAHEVYATWMSISLLSENMNDQLHLQLLDDNEEYMDYYMCADAIVKSVPDNYLRRHIVTAIISICFQSKPITDAVLANIEAFDPDIFNINEFPNQRLSILAKESSKIDWMAMLKTFTETQKELPWYRLLTDALGGNGDDWALTHPDNEENSSTLIRFIYDRLVDKLNAQGLLSLPYLEHMPYFKQLLPLLDKIAPFNQSANPLTINSKPDDITRSVLQNFENETQLFTMEPLTCILLWPDDILAATKAQILSGTGDSPHIFVVGRTHFFMKKQYTFPIQGDTDWCNTNNGAFTAIRYAQVIEGHRFVIYVPFSDPEKLHTFIKEKPTDIPVLGSISATACYFADWWGKWECFFTVNCFSACILLDISPLHYIEQICLNTEDLLYVKFDIRLETNKRSGMVFQLRANGQTSALLLAPCSEIHLRGLHYYIKTHFSKFENKLDLPEEHLQNIPIILSHIFREEHQHYYLSHA
jgi:hypothetical protein